VRELTNQANELTEDDLALVSGGNPKGGIHSQPLAFLKITMKEVLVSSY
jgi:bacteriocin-like protein